MRSPGRIDTLQDLSSLGLEHLKFYDVEVVSVGERCKILAVNFEDST